MMYKEALSFATAFTSRCALLPHRRGFTQPWPPGAGALRQDTDVPKGFLKTVKQEDLHQSKSMEHFEKYVNSW